MKRKLVVVCAAILLLPLAFGLIQPVKAPTNSHWFYWHDYVDYY